MSKADKPTKRGRPKLAKTMRQASIRLDEDLAGALEQYRVANGLDDLSGAVRHILRMALRSGGLLGEVEPKGAQAKPQK